jgi:hypothetical protein
MNRISKLLVAACVLLVTSTGWSQEKPATANQQLSWAFVPSQPQDKTKPTSPKAELGYFLSQGEAQVTGFDVQYIANAQFVANDLAPWTGAFGINVEPVSGALQQQLKLKPSEGILVIDLNDESLAKQADLQKFDVIVGLDKKPDPAKPVKVKLIRSGVSQERTLKAPTPKKQYWIGVHLQTIEEPLRTQLSLPEGKGLLLSEVVNDSPAKKAGLQTYDVVVGTEKLDFSKTEDLAERVQQTEGKPIELRLIRHAKPLTLAVTPIERPQATVELSVENAKSQLLLSRVLLANDVQAETYRWLVARNQTLDPHIVLNLQAQDTPTQIANLQAELAKMTASATAMQEQLQKLAEQIKQTPKK